MKFLILTDDSSIENDLIGQIESNIKDGQPDFITLNLSEKNIKKGFAKVEKELFSLVAIFLSQNALDNTDASNVLMPAFFSGFFAKDEIPVVTNCSFLKNIVCDSFVKYVSNFDELSAYISKNIKKINKNYNTKNSKNCLMDKGIPCTAECFGLYIRKNKEDICELFINAGIDIDCKDDFGTPMINIAIRNDNSQMINKLISMGCDINCVSEDRGYTPVMDAVWRGNKEVTELLISKGAELNTINKEGQTNLVLAVGADKTEIVKLLVENGADPDIKDSMGMSAYGYASLFKKQEILEILEPYHKA